jgi:ribose-phosphate pyrophosphokinase
VYNARANHITAVIPYFCYARQNNSRASKKFYEPNSAQLIAKFLENSGINKIITMDLHTEKICSFFQISCINLYNTNNIIQDLNHKQLNNLTIVAPDLGSMLRTQKVINYLPATGSALIYKQRLSSGKTINTKVVGEIKNRNCIIIDDIIDTATTICAAAEILKKQRAAQIIVYCTHPIFSCKAIQKIQKSPISEVIVTDTIPLSPKAKKCTKIRQLSVAQIFADAVKQ